MQKDPERMAHTHTLALTLTDWSNGLRGVGIERHKHTHWEYGRHNVRMKESVMADKYKRKWKLLLESKNEENERKQTMNKMRWISKCTIYFQWQRFFLLCLVLGRYSKSMECGRSDTNWILDFNLVTTHDNDRIGYSHIFDIMQYSFLFLLRHHSSLIGTNTKISC